MTTTAVCEPEVTDRDGFCEATGDGHRPSADGVSCRACGATFPPEAEPTGRYGYDPEAGW